MSLESIPNLSLGTAAIAIFLVCAAYVMLRGITRVLIGTAVLAISVWFGFIAWQVAPELSVNWVGKSIAVITTGLPIAVFIISFVAIRVSLKWVASPFGASKKEQATPSKGIPAYKVILLLAIALIPTFILLSIGIGFIHHTASVQELRNFATTQSSPAANSDQPFLQKLKLSIEQSVPPKWLEMIDPLAKKSRLTFAKLVATQSQPELDPVIDPATGEPIPRAIVVDDPELQKLAREQKFGTLLRHPVITEALEDPEVQKLLKGLKL